MSNINLPEKNLHLSCPNANANCVPPTLINVSCFMFHTKTLINKIFVKSIVPSLQFMTKTDYACKKLKS